MEEYLKNSTFYIVPENIENINNFKLLKYNDEYIVLNSPQLSTEFTKNENIEVFTNSTKGIIYFKSKVYEYSNNNLTLLKPENYQILQRRENERIILNENITLMEDNNKICAKLSDLSVGGMKIECENQLKINNAYRVELNFDNINLQFTFTPLRISFENDIYNISGQLTADKASDKIELVQYCYKKLFEQSNR